jgi:hypothetical protein
MTRHALGSRRLVKKAQLLVLDDAEHWHLMFPGLEPHRNILKEEAVVLKLKLE